MSYRAVIFDLFGTLVDNFTKSAHEAVLVEMAARLGAPGPDFVAAWLDSYELRNRGAFPSARENIEYVCRALQYEPAAEALTAAAEMRLDFTRRYLNGPRADAVPTLTLLRQMGHVLGLVSDCAAEVPTLWESTVFAPLITAPVFSCAVKMKKPEPGIYRLACTRLDVAPEECLYVGDGSSHELTGAAAVGMHPVLIRMAHEENEDSYRPDEDTWEGDTVRCLAEVVAFAG